MFFFLLTYICRYGQLVLFFSADDLTPENVGLTADMQYFKASGYGGVPPPVAYMHIFESEKFSVPISRLSPSLMYFRSTA